jgi:hypothetical protein
MLSAPRTLAAMLIAPFGAMAAHLMVSATLGDLETIRSSAAATVLVGGFSAVAGLVLVLPLLLLIPALRLLPSWAATAWGAAIALLVTVILVGPAVTSRTSAIAMATLGAGSGLTYAIAARALMRLQRRV